MKHPNEDKSPIQVKKDILNEYKIKGGSVLINNHRSITVDDIEKDNILYYIAGGDKPQKISISSITEIRDHKTGEKLFPKE